MPGDQQKSVKGERDCNRSDIICKHFHNCAVFYKNNKIFDLPGRNSVTRMVWNSQWKTSINLMTWGQCCSLMRTSTFQECYISPSPCTLLLSAHLSLGSLGVSSEVLGGVVCVVSLTSLLHTEHAAERTVGDLVLPLVLKQIFLHLFSIEGWSMLVR